MGNGECWPIEDTFGVAQDDAYAIHCRFAEVRVRVSELNGVVAQVD